MIVWTINITYEPNEETDMCATCKSQLNTRFALGKFECGHCKNKFHWICLVSWAKKAREFQDHSDVSNVLVRQKKPESFKITVIFVMFWFIISQIKTHTCCQCIYFHHVGNMLADMLATCPQHITPQPLQFCEEVIIKSIPQQYFPSYHNMLLL
jgi:hypothetical protein